MKLAIIATGIPGSGKTTLLKPLAARYGLAYISRDDIRQEWFGNPLARTDQDRVWAEAEHRASEALTAGRSVILDSTFAEHSKRATVIEMARRAGADRIISILFTVSPDVAKERNRLRDIHVREDVIDHVHERILKESPSLEEGFDALYTSDRIDEFERNELGDEAA